jgi:predicted transcriptional regulator
MKLDGANALGKIMEYLVRLSEQNENGTTLYRITRDAFLGLTTQKESRIRKFLENLILKDYVRLLKMGDGHEYYSVTQEGIDFYKDNLKKVIDVLGLQEQPFNKYD